MQQLIPIVIGVGMILGIWGICAIFSGAQVFDHESDRRKFDDWENDQNGDT